MEEQLATTQTKLEKSTNQYNKLKMNLKKTNMKVTEEWNQRNYMREQELTRMITIKQNKVTEAMESTMIKPKAKFKERFHKNLDNLAPLIITKQNTLRAKTMTIT
jgi:hypothetical protein